MRLIHLPRMIISFHDGWGDLIRLHPSVSGLFLALVLPLSLLSAAMLHHAGALYGDVFIAGVGGVEWQRASLVFLFAELLTVPFMAWIIHSVVRINNITADYHECFVLAAVAPIPLWLSSVALLVPSLPFNLAVGAVALTASVGLIYHGVYALFGLRQGGEARAFQMASVIAGAGLLAWLLLMQITLVH